jgi:hypothetical protein
MELIIKMLHQGAEVVKMQGVTAFVESRYPKKGWICRLMFGNKTYVGINLERYLAIVAAKHNAAYGIENKEQSNEKT